MTNSDGAGVRVVLYDGSGSEPIGNEDRFEIMSALLDRGFAVTQCNGQGKVSASDGSRMLVVGRFAEQPPAAAIDPKTNGAVSFEDISGKDPKSVVDAVEQFEATANGSTRAAWKPWFPVIDYDRCTNCMQCLSFCLFDVYGVDGGEKITVRNQTKCKTDCPACSRVCPEVAILFPKYAKGPINGDVVREADILREAMKVDISALLGGDIYSSLRTRQSEARKRFSTERDESKALLERRRCLKKLQGDLDIPDEVLMSLPSAGDIRERAERAKAKAEKRKARSQTVKDQRPAPSEDEWGI